MELALETLHLLLLYYYYFQLGIEQTFVTLNICMQVCLCLSWERAVDLPNPLSYK